MIREKIKRREFALPIGLCAPTSYQVRFQNKKKEEFGNNPDFQCPFYLQGELNCGIWNYRGSECTTFFCMSSYGEKGEEYWSHWRDYLFQLEMGLSQEVLAQEAFSESEVEAQLPFLRWSRAEGQAELNALEWTGFWKEHVDDIEGFYLRAYEHVKLIQPARAKELLQDSTVEKSIYHTYIQFQSDEIHP